MFTTEITELTEFDHTQMERFGPGRRRGFRRCWDRKEWWGKSLIERTNEAKMAAMCYQLKMFVEFRLRHLGVGRVA